MRSAHEYLRHYPALRAPAGIEGVFYCRDAKFCVSTGILISLDPCPDDACEGNADG